MSTLLAKLRQERFDKFVFVLRTIRSGLERGRRTNKRDLYYQEVQRFPDQRDLDEVVAKVVSILGIPRILLGVVATSKGLVAGNIRFVDEAGVLVDCLLSEVGTVLFPDTRYININTTPGTDYISTGYCILKIGTTQRLKTSRTILLIRHLVVGVIIKLRYLSTATETSPDKYI